MNLCGDRDCECQHCTEIAVDKRENPTYPKESLRCEVKRRSYKKQNLHQEDARLNDLLNQSRSASECMDI